MTPDPQTYFDLDDCYPLDYPLSAPLPLPQPPLPKHHNCRCVTLEDQPGESLVSDLLLHISIQRLAQINADALIARQIFTEEHRAMGWTVCDGHIWPAFSQGRTN